MELEDTIKNLDREIGKKRHQETSERQDVMIGLLAKMGETLDDLAPSIEESSLRTNEAISALSEDVKNIKIETPTVNVNVPDVNVPEIKLPTINVPKIETPIIPEIKIPEIKIPKITVPKPEVTVNVPEIKIPKIEVPKIEMPDRMNVDIANVNQDNPLPVILTDKDGKFYKAIIEAVGGGSGNIGGLIGAQGKWYGENGLQIWKESDGMPRIVSQTYYEQIAEGNISEHTAWSKIGYNASVGITEEDLWPVGGSYAPPTAQMRMEVVSSNANDDSVGIGVQKVKIWYLDNTFTEKTEVIELDGVTPVPTVATDIYRVNHFRAYQCGTGGKAAGDIDIRHLTDTPIYGRIATGYTRARTCFYTVPKGKALYIFNVLCSSGGTAKPTRFTTRATYDNRDGVIKDFFLPYNEMIITDSALDMPLEIPTKFTEGVDLKVSAVAGQDGTLCSVSLRGWLETN